MSEAAPPQAGFLLSGAGARHTGNAELRTRGPVQEVQLASGDTVWLVTGHAEARRALVDRRLSGRTGAVGSGRAIPQDLRLGMNTHMLNLDPPDHTRLRRLVSAVFTRRRIEQLRPRVEQVSAQLLDAMAGQDTVDLIEAFALPLPMTVLTDLLGVPRQDAGALRKWTETLTASKVSLGELEVAGYQMLGYVRDLLGEKRRAPGEDLLSALVGVRDGEDRLTEDELTSMIFLMLIAGHETTVNLIGNGTLALLRDPAQRAAITADPVLMPSAVEEFLRYETPVQAAMRYSTEPVTLAGQTIPAGATVMVSLLAANRDPGRFAEPDRLDVGRADNPQLAFGHGIHHCLGAPLARMEGALAITALLTRFPGFALAAPIGALRWRVSMIMHGLERLPVRLR